MRFFCFPYFVGKHSNGFSLSVLPKLKANGQCENHVRLVHSGRVWRATVESAWRAISEKATTTKKKGTQPAYTANIWNKVPFHPLLVHPSSCNHPILPVCTWGPPPHLSLIPTNEIWRKEGEGGGRDFYPRDKNWKRDLKCHHGIPRKGAGFDKIWIKTVEVWGNSLSG